MMINALVYLTAAVICVPLARWLGLGSVLGYLIAGAVIGPWGLGFVQDVECTQRDITHIADRRGNNMQARRQRRFTRPLPIASL